MTINGFAIFVPYIFYNLGLADIRFADPVIYRRLKTSASPQILIILIQISGRLLALLFSLQIYEFVVCRLRHQGNLWIWELQINQFKFADLRVGDIKKNLRANLCSLHRICYIFHQSCLHLAGWKAHLG